MAVLMQAQVAGQLDPEKRRLIQLGYNQPLEGKSPIAAYGFYYYNRPEFMRTNMTLRLAVAPIYLDTELGFKGVFTPNTDVGLGVSGGGFADTYSEIIRGNFQESESFTGHGAEFGASIYHRLNPDWRVPAWVIGRLSVRHSFFDADSDTADNFEVPDDVNSFNFRTGLRVGGREPSLTSPLAMEFSIWYQGHYRAEAQRYGFSNDREINDHTHIFWGADSSEVHF